MEKIKSFVKKHPVWIGIITLVLLFIVIGILTPPETGIKRHGSIMAEKEKTSLCGTIDGVLTLVSIYNEEGNCAWIDGHAKIILKDSSGNEIKTKEIDLKKKDIMLGSSCMADSEIIINNMNELDKIKTITLEYTATDGNKYTVTDEVTEPYNYCY